MRSDGGPAFGGYARHHNSVAGQEWFSDEPVMGMSLRDYFAAAAMQGAMANERLLPSTQDELNHLAMRVYEMADAMIAERDKP